MFLRNHKTVQRVAAAAEAGRTHASKMRRRAATVAACTLTVVMAYTVVFGQNGLTAFEHKRQDAHDLQQQLDALQKENDRLTLHVQHLQSDPGAVEHEAREELHYTRSGEVIYALPADASAKPGLPPVPTAKP